MIKNQRMMGNLGAEHIKNGNQMDRGVVDRVDLRINKVNTKEIEQLSTVFYALRSHHYHDHVIKTGNGDRVFVVTVKSARLEEIKEALHVILRVVKGERIAIET